MKLNIPFCLTVGLLFLLASCAPVRYSDEHKTTHQSVGSSATPVGKTGVVKRGKPYKIAGKWYYPLASGEQYNQVGIASWYGKKFHGRKTANGEIYNMYGMTAAHTTLPLPSVVLVTNLDNGKSIQVRVNDRGPFVKSRLIDLSYSAAKALGYVKKGTARVRVQTLGIPRHNNIQQPASVSAPSVPVAPIIAPTVTVAKHQHVKPKLAYIQVGAFSAKTNAHGVAGKLQTYLNESHPPLKVVSVGAIYRVRVGPFDLDEDAQKALRLIQSNGYDAAMIIHD